MHMVVEVVLRLTGSGHYFGVIAISIWPIWYRSPLAVSRIVSCKYSLKVGFCPTALAAAKI